jgi:hypothetical protein
MHINRVETDGGIAYGEDDAALFGTGSRFDVGRS